MRMRYLVVPLTLAAMTAGVPRSEAAKPLISRKAILDGLPAAAQRAIRAKLGPNVHVVEPTMTRNGGSANGLGRIGSMKLGPAGPAHYLRYALPGSGYPAEWDAGYSTVATNEGGTADAVVHQFFVASTPVPNAHDPFVRITSSQKLHLGGNGGPALGKLRTTIEFAPDGEGPRYRLPDYATIASVTERQSGAQTTKLPKSDGTVDKIRSVRGAP